MNVGARIRITAGDAEDLPQLPDGVVIAFIPGYAPHQAAALLHLDTPITVGAVTGDSVVMELRYEGAVWDREGEPGSQTVGLDLYAQPPAASLDSQVAHVGLTAHAIFEILPNAI